MTPLDQHASLAISSQADQPPGPGGRGAQRRRWRAGQGGPAQGRDVQPSRARPPAPRRRPGDRADQGSATAPRRAG
nr:hypothetical protein [Nocardioides convexus]